MEYSTIVTFQRKGKFIDIFLETGSHITLENIVDVIVTPAEESSGQEDQKNREKG